MSMPILITVGTVLLIGIGVVAWLNHHPERREKADRRSSSDTGDGYYASNSDGRKPDPRDSSPDDEGAGDSSGGGDGGGDGGGGDGGGD